MLSLFLLSLLAPTVKAQEPHPFFDGDAVHEIRITFAQQDWWDQLRRNFEGKADPEYLEATFDWGDVHLERVGVRFKGNSSYGYPSRKKSLKLKTNAFVKGQKIQGMNVFNFNNAFKDPSIVREKVFYELAAEAGLATPRVNYAAIYLNGEYWGLYFLTEDVDGDFLESRFGKKEGGNLYKGDPQGTLEWRGPDVNFYRRMYEKANNEDADDWSDLIGLVNVLNNTPPARLAEALEPRLDVESVFTYLALCNLTVNLDSYLGSGHNYYLYHRQADDRMVMVPWDPNEAWGVFTLNQPVNGLMRLTPFYTGSPQPPPGMAPPPMQPQSRPLATRLWAVPEYRARYEERLKELRDGVAGADKTLERMAALRDLIRPWVSMERQNMFPLADFERSLLEDVNTGQPQGPPVGPPGPGVQPGPPPMTVPGLSPFIRGRAAFLETALQ